MVCDWFFSGPCRDLATSTARASYESLWVGDGLDDVCLCGTGLAPSQGGFENSPNDRAIRAHLVNRRAAPIAASSKLLCG